jgi:co-chaperonin GroES (HSP10)
MIIPVGYRVLVKTKTYVEHDKAVSSARAAGIEVVLDSETRYDASVDEGVVVMYGADAWSNCKKRWAEIGDTVVYAKNSGKEVKDPEDQDTRYVVLNDEDIIAVVKE